MGWMQHREKQPLNVGTQHGARDGWGETKSLATLQVAASSIASKPIPNVCPPGSGSVAAAIRGRVRSFPLCLLENAYSS